MEFGLIGRHLGHSYSREIHALIPAGYDYSILELEPEEIGAFMTKRDFRGINVTIPYKQAVIPFIDVLSPEAELTKSVNTVVNKGGKLYGYNTDVFGLTSQIKKAGLSLKGRTVMITGTGGVSGSVIAAVKKENAANIISVSRKAKQGCITYGEIDGYAGKTDIIINATPVGMFPSPEFSPLEAKGFPNLCGIIDLIYNPLRTRLVQDGLSLGINSSGGLYMLCAQGVKAASLFTGNNYGEELTAGIYEKLISQKENIVLIGMPSSGKTTVGKLISEKCGKTFIDTDTIIENNAKMAIPAIFASKGEEYFRCLEAEAVSQAANGNTCVIATGGGVILSEENIRLLKQNGKLYFLDRSPEKLVYGGERPLSSSSEAVKKLYETRYPLYKKYADCVISADETPEKIAEIIRRNHYEASCS